MREAVRLSAAYGDFGEVFFIGPESSAEKYLKQASKIS